MTSEPPHERICDRITASAAGAEGPPARADAETMGRLADYLAARPDDRPGMLPCSSTDAALVSLFDGGVDELAHMVRLRERGDIAGAPHPAGTAPGGMAAN